MCGFTSQASIARFLIALWGFKNVFSGGDLGCEEDLPAGSHGRSECSSVQDFDAWVSC